MNCNTCGYILIYIFNFANDLKIHQHIKVKEQHHHTTEGKFFARFLAQRASTKFGHVMDSQIMDLKKRYLNEKSNASFFLYL